jgi:hypothetical protein
MKIKDLLIELGHHNPEAEVMIPKIYNDWRGGLTPVTHIAWHQGGRVITEVVFPYDENPKEFVELFYHTGL